MLTLIKSFLNISGLTSKKGLFDFTTLGKDKISICFFELKKYIFNDKKVADGKLNLILINQKFKAFKTNQFDQNNIRKAFK